MILCINQELVPGKDPKYRKVVLQADSTTDIATMPTTGENVAGLDDNCVVYPSSILFCLENAHKHVYGGDEQWHDVTESA